MNFRFLDPAEEEMAQAARTYEDQAVGLGEQFRTKVNPHATDTALLNIVSSRDHGVRIRVYRWSLRYSSHASRNEGGAGSRSLCVS